ncbi:Hypothetical protein A7982_10422 [Minicystis rosea]|nr:Hypothetical protein A7982_01026 [Minicystis rosea]APR78690.1 Hypothetical protein A7982_04037 [Minicystis rosea]APR85073.1 Hypothetical protein A7982_10422 [Minicystis rosea]
MPGPTSSLTLSTVFAQRADSLSNCFAHSLPDRFAFRERIGPVRAQHIKSSRPNGHLDPSALTASAQWARKP